MKFGSLCLSLSLSQLHFACRGVVGGMCLRQFQYLHLTLNCSPVCVCCVRDATTLRGRDGYGARGKTVPIAGRAGRSGRAGIQSSGGEVFLSVSHLCSRGRQIVLHDDTRRAINTLCEYRLASPNSSEEHAELPTGGGKREGISARLAAPNSRIIRRRKSDRANTLRGFPARRGARCSVHSRLSKRTYGDAMVRCC
jgi:hypothetical protein